MAILYQSKSGKRRGGLAISHLEIVGIAENKGKMSSPTGTSSQCDGIEWVLAEYGGQGSAPWPVSALPLHWKFYLRFLGKTKKWIQ
jgi:hypothetical protein